MLRSVVAVALFAISSSSALAQAETKKDGDKPAEAAKPDPKKEEAKKDEPPALPPAVTDTGTTTTTTATEPSTSTSTSTSALSTEDIAKLKAELKSELKAEVQAELKAQMQSEMEAAARDQATQKAAAQEWQEERWIEEVKPKLNFLELDGYFRFRFDLFNRLDLGTYDPVTDRGTSNFPAPTLYRPFDGADCVDGQENFAGDACEATAEDTQTLLSANMRLRLDPVLNVSEDIKIRSTIDIFDNIVLGSSPESLPGFAQNPTLPLPLFASSQNPPQAGVNSLYDAIRVRRLWAEIMTPIGQLRVGRMPQNWGLGLLANDGNKLDNDFGDQADQIVFGTRVAGHVIAPGYSFSSTGAFGRGGGSGFTGDFNQGSFLNEQGQRYNLDPKDDVHSFLLVIAKRDKDEDIEEQLRQGNWILNYGLFGVYRTQQFDNPNYYVSGTPGGVNPVSPGDYVVRNANAGIGSLWGRFNWDKLKIEAEAVGIIGQADGTAVTSGGLNEGDGALNTVVDGEVVGQPLFILQGGLAIESSYRFLNDQLEVGLDFGIASGDDAPGMGLRPVINQNPKAGDLDGRQYGECLDALDDGDGIEGDPVDGVNCAKVDNDITNFRFDPDYNVDMILFREILGTVNDAMYFKPHIGYYFTPDLGVRADIIYSQAVFASSTPGQENPLGIELDAKAFYATEDGFHLMPQIGFFLPFGGLNHFDKDLLSNDKFATAQFAWTFQLFAGVQF